MQPRTPEINLDVLRDVLAQAKRMVAHYEQSDEKIRQNEALVAAGLKPMHSETQLKWDRDNAAQERRRVECLTAAIAYLEQAFAKSEAA